MKLFRNLFLVVLTSLMVMGVCHAELIDKSSIRYKETPESLIFVVSKQHAVDVIEPQIKFNWKLSQYKNEKVRNQLSTYVKEHTRFMLQHMYGLQEQNIKVENTYIGYPSTLPNGLMFVSDVRIKKGLLWKKVRAGFVIPAVSGFTADEIVYFTYPN